MKMIFACYFYNKIYIKGALKPYDGRYTTEV